MLKHTPFRSPQYLAFVRTLPCSVCGIEGVDAHHVIGRHWGLSGMGMKAPDSLCMPLCREHHQAVHQRPELQCLQASWLLSTLSAGMKRFPDGELHEALVEAHNWCWTFQLGERA